jgi:NitT/TauT family transport system substrate-binding protein
VPRVCLSALCLAVLLVIAGRTASSQTPAVDLSVAINAPGAGNWIAYVAQRQGFFRAEGLNVTLVISGNPTNTLNLLASGGVGIGLDGSDALIAANVHHLPVKIIAPEFGPNPYSVLVVPSVTRWSDLKGKTVILGPKQDVSAVTFYRMIEAQQLKLDDMTVTFNGTSSSRYAALISGNVQATLLSQPFDILAQAHGMRLLAAAATFLKPWMDTSFAINTNWAVANRATAVHFVRALRKAVRFAYANREPAIVALVEATNIDRSIAEKAYDLDFKQLRAFDPDLRINVPGLQFMAAMLVGDGAIAAAPNISDLLDTSYVAEAAR